MAVLRIGASDDGDAKHDQRDGDAVGDAHGCLPHAASAARSFTISAPSSSRSRLHRLALSPETSRSSLRSYGEAAPDSTAPPAPAAAGNTGWPSRPVQALS